jgi:hypothetical protein
MTPDQWPVITLNGLYSIRATLLIRFLAGAASAANCFCWRDSFAAEAAPTGCVDALLVISNDKFVSNKFEQL